MVKKLELGDTCKNGHLQTEESRMANGRCSPCSIDRHFRHRLKTGIILPQDTPANMRPYKEPLQPVEGGFGYLGTLAHNVEGTHVQCHICGFFYPNVGSHANKIHGVARKEYREQFQLSRRTALVSEQARNECRNASLMRTPESKQKWLNSLVGARARRQGESTSAKKSLEAKNKEGRCYYQLLDKIETLGKKLGKTPTRRQFEQEYGSGYWGSVLETFGSWNQAVTFAGFTPTSFRGTREKYSRDMVISMIRAFWEQEGRAPRALDMGKGIPSSRVIRRHFGGIVDAREAAGLGNFDFIHEMGEIV